MHSPTTTPLTEEGILARLLYRDALILVLNKPAGIAVHITGHDKIALDQSFHHLQFGLPKKPELAHRLDRGTSGCLVLGRHRQALIKLGKLFEKQRVNKTYRAICVGVPEQPEGIINRPILKSGVGSKWKMSLDNAGQEAVTEYKVVRSFIPPPVGGRLGGGHCEHTDASEFPSHSSSPRVLGTPPPQPSPYGGGSVLSEILFFPKTGRTHQIRLHAAFALGCPVVGDPFYGPMEGEFSAAKLPMMLHAETVEIPLQQSKPPIIVSAPLPVHMVGLLERFGA
jgi:tRNA pseudouridine32 synthase / 23S rRNA pseudouridine746 synthase